MKKIEKDIENQVQSKMMEHHNEKFLDELLYIQQRNTKQKPRKTLFKLSQALIVGSLLIVMIMSCLTVYYFTPNEPTKKEYSIGNQSVENISLEELNEALLGINIIDKDIVKIIKCKDDYYNELLFYNISLDSDEAFITTHISIIINPDYPNIRDVSILDKETTINNYTLKYFVSSSYDGELYGYKVYAKIDIDSIRVFIDYEEFAFEEGNSFFDYIAQIIK